MALNLDDLEKSLERAMTGARSWVGTFPGGRAETVVSTGPFNAVDITQEWQIGVSFVLEKLLRNIGHTDENSIATISAEAMNALGLNVVLTKVAEKATISGGPRGRTAVVTITDDPVDHEPAG